MIEKNNISDSLLQERSEEYSLEALKKIDLISLSNKAAIMNYLTDVKLTKFSGNKNHPFVLYGERGSGKTLYAQVCAQSVFDSDKIAHLIYKSGGKLELKVGDSRKNINHSDLEEVLDDNKYDAFIIDDIPYMLEAAEKGKIDDSEVFNVIEKAYELSKTKKVIIAIDTWLTKYVDHTFRLDVKEDTKILHDPYLARLVVDMGAIGGYGPESSNSLKQAMINNTKRRFEDKAELYRMHTLNNFEHQEFFLSQPENINVDNETVNLISKLSNNPRKLIKLINEFAVNGDPEEIYNIHKNKRITVSKKINFEEIVNGMFDVKSAIYDVFGDLKSCFDISDLDDAIIDTVLCRIKEENKYLSNLDELKLNTYLEDNTTYESRLFDWSSGNDALDNMILSQKTTFDELNPRDNLINQLLDVSNSPEKARPYGKTAKNLCRAGLAQRIKYDKGLEMELTSDAKILADTIENAQGIMDRFYAFDDGRKNSYDKNSKRFEIKSRFIENILLKTFLDKSKYPNYWNQKNQDELYNLSSMLPKHLSIVRNYSGKILPKKVKLLTENMEEVEKRIHIFKPEVIFQRFYPDFFTNEDELKLDEKIGTKAVSGRKK